MQCGMQAAEGLGADCWAILSPVVPWFYVGAWPPMRSLSLQLHVAKG